MRVGYVCLMFTIVLLVGLFSRFCWDYFINDMKWQNEYILVLLNYLTIGFTVIIVGVPEYLIVTFILCLNLSLKRMAEDNNRVIHLPACEAMANVDNIIVNKTGVLTENRMTVELLYLNGKSFSFDYI